MALEYAKDHVWEEIIENIRNRRKILKLVREEIGSDEYKITKARISECTQIIQLISDKYKNKLLKNGK